MMLDDILANRRYVCAIRRENIDSVINCDYKKTKERPARSAPYVSIRKCSLQLLRNARTGVVSAIGKNDRNNRRARSARDQDRNHGLAETGG